MMGDRDTWSVIHLQSTFQFYLGCCHCRKPCFTKMGCWRWKQAFQCFCGDLRIFCLDLNPEYMEIWSCLILLRPLLFAVSSSDSLRTWTKFIQLAYSQIGHGSIPSQFGGPLWLGSNAQTLLKAEIGDHAPAWRMKALALSLSISANVWNVKNRSVHLVPP